MEKTIKVIEFTAFHHYLQYLKVALIQLFNAFHMSMLLNYKMVRKLARPENVANKIFCSFYSVRALFHIYLKF